MELKDLEMFIEVVRYNSLTKAAERMNIAQSALSRRIARLEYDLGLQLFVRHARGVHVTKEGERLAKEGGVLFKQLTELCRELRTEQHPRQKPVKVGIPPISAQFVAPALMRSAAAYSPAVEVQLVEGETSRLHGWIQDNTVDIAILYLDEFADELDVTVLLEEPLWLAISPALRARHPLPDTISLKHLVDLPLIIPNDKNLQGSEREISRLIKGLGPGYGRAFLPSQGTNTTMGMVKSGFGCSLFPYVVVYREVEDGILEAVRIEPPLMSYIQMVTNPHNRNASDGIEAVKAILVEVFRQLPATGIWKGAAPDS